jgi:hypothetical protein
VDPASLEAPLWAAGCYVPPPCQFAQATYYSGVIDPALSSQSCCADDAPALLTVPLELPSPRSWPAAAIAGADDAAAAVFRLGTYRRAACLLQEAGTYDACLSLAAAGAGDRVVLRLVDDGAEQWAAGDAAVAHTCDGESTGRALQAGDRLTPLTAGGAQGESWELPEPGLPPRWREAGRTREGFRLLVWPP